MVRIQHHLPVILPLGQEFQRSASFTNEFQKALFSIVEFKNILNYIYYSLSQSFFFFLAYLSELQLNFSLSHFNFSLFLF